MNHKKTIEKMKENEKSEEEERGGKERAKQSNAWSVARLTEENEMRGKGQHCRLGIWTENRATADADEKMREVRNGQGKELALAAQGEKKEDR